MIIINLFNLFAKIELDDKGFKKGVESASKEGKGLSSSLSSIGNGIGTLASGITKAVGITSTAITGLATLSIKQYAEFEQLVGGVETLFKDSSSLVMEYSENAYKTAGMSANEYMSTITGFSASLIQGLGGDTKKASEAGNKAITDMSDNANKMGTSMESIQNAYQGFAKQNYTMLDNLKLGYGGTKEEMQRLLEKAEEVTGISYDISNFADIIEAIHIIQDEMDITGTTAKESAETISGSWGTLKGAWSNMLTGFADENADFDTLVGNLFNSVSSFGDNILPRIKTTLEGIGIFISEFSHNIPNVIMEVLPTILNTGIEVVKSLIEGISGSLPALLTSGFEIVMSLFNAIVELLPTLLELGLQAIITLGQGIAGNIPALIPTVIEMIIGLCDMIIENLPMIFDTAIDIILALVSGLVEALPTLLEEVPRIINSFSSAIYDLLPQILKAGVDILLMLIKGLIDSIPTLIDNIPQIITAIVNVFTLYNWWNLGKSLITGIGEGIKGMAQTIGETARGLASNIIESIKNVFLGGGNVGMNFVTFIGNGISSMLSTVVGIASNLGSSVISGIKRILNLDSLKTVGSNLIKGLWNGISNMSGWILDKIGGFASSIIEGAKDFFGINSPSKVFKEEVGVFLAQGIGVGFEEEMENVNSDIKNSLTYDFELDKKQEKTGAGVVVNQTINSKAVLSPLEIAQETKNGLDRARWSLA